jgi:hypothetical protein
MAYAIVQDVPASWSDYEALTGMGGVPPDGLILHVAGPTDEGFRTIEIWESRDACDRFHAGITPDHWRRHGCVALPIQRELSAEITLRGRVAAAPDSSEDAR